MRPGRFLTVWVCLTGLATCHHPADPDPLTTQAIYRGFPVLLWSTCLEKASDQELKPADAVVWARDSAWNEISSDFERVHGLTSAQLERVWAARAGSIVPITASYGAGSFLASMDSLPSPEADDVDDPDDPDDPDERTLEEKIQEKIQEKIRQKKERHPKDPLSGVTLPVEEQPVRDPVRWWWHRASARQKAEFLMARFAEFSGRVEVIEIRAAPCTLCMGSGRRQEFLCPRCRGGGSDRVVVFQ